MILPAGASVALKEITSWPDCEHVQANHTYFLNDKDKLVGYKISGKNEYTIFKKPLRFNKARRKFVKLKSEKCPK